MPPPFEREVFYSSLPLLATKPSPLYPSYSPFSTQSPKFGRRAFNSPSSSAMPPPFEHKAFNLTLLPNTYFVKQLPTSDGVPSGVLLLFNEPGFFSITRTPEEISIVGEMTKDPRVLYLSGGVGDWRCIKIAGPMEFGKSLPLFKILLSI